MSTTIQAEDLVTVSIPREHARHVASIVMWGLRADAEDVVRAGDTPVGAEVRRGLEHELAMLDDLKWGEPAADVTLSATRDELEEFAGHLMDHDRSIAEGRPTTLEAMRRHAGRIAAGAAIFDQLEAAR
jgi:Arc/MetJ-type ribon-helix-helix transcriptional regulator